MCLIPEALVPKCSTPFEAEGLRHEPSREGYAERCRGVCPSAVLSPCCSLAAPGAEDKQ